jgi:hypothetical protein
MKSFSKFISEATVSRAVVQGKALGLTNIGPDGRSHGDWYQTYPNGTKEFAAKTSGRGLVFYNQGQVTNKKDPKQIRTQANQQPVATQIFTRREEVSPNYEQELREKYIAREIFNEGEMVESLITGKTGKILRRGTNYLICVTEQDEMFKSWIRDVKEYTEVKMDSIERQPGKPNTLIGTDGYRKFAMKMMGMDKILNFNTDSKKLINKYRKK